MAEWWVIRRLHPKLGAQFYAGRPSIGGVRWVSYDRYAIKFDGYAQARDTMGRLTDVGRLAVVPQGVSQLEATESP